MIMVASVQSVIVINLLLLLRLRVYLTLRVAVDHYMVLKESRKSIVEMRNDVMEMLLITM